MKTSMDIPAELLSEARKQSGASTNRKAVIIALSDYVRRQKLKGAVHLLGTFIDLPDIQTVVATRRRRK
jgi:Arc/MetJ family transcription regulator